MARKSAIVQITDDNRDRGKVFHILEMPAAQAERWAIRAFQALARSDVEIPDNVAGAGFAGIAKLGFQALAKMDEISLMNLMDEMMLCVSFQPDPRKPEIVRPLVEEDIEEVQTRLRLRLEVFQLHTGFSMTGSGLITAPSASPLPVEGSSNTRTFRARSAR